MEALDNAAMSVFSMELSGCIDEKVKEKLQKKKSYRKQRNGN